MPKLIGGDVDAHLSGNLAKDFGILAIVEIPQHLVVRPAGQLTHKRCCPRPEIG